MRCTSPQDVLRERFDDVFSGRATDERSQRALESRAAGTKALGTWHGTGTIQECREACGGAGFLSANRFSALKADTDVYTTFEGDNHVLLQLVAKGLLTDYSSDFSDLDQFGMVRFVAGMAVEQVVERTNVHKLLERIKDVLPGGDQWDQEAGLLDPNYQLGMLEFREEHMLAGVAKRLKRGIDNDMQPGQVFSAVQDHVIAAARAHVERLVLEAFVERLQELEDGPNKVALGLLCDLFALSTIEQDRAWFMEHGRMSSPRGKQISPRGQRPVPQDPPAGCRPGQRLRRTRGDAALGGADRLTRLSGPVPSPVRGTCGRTGRARCSRGVRRARSRRTRGWPPAAG